MHAGSTEARPLQFIQSELIPQAISLVDSDFQVKQTCEDSWPWKRILLSIASMLLFVIRDSFHKAIASILRGQFADSCTCGTPHIVIGKYCVIHDFCIDKFRQQNDMFRGALFRGHLITSPLSCLSVQVCMVVVHVMFGSFVPHISFSGCVCLLFLPSLVCK